MRGRLPKDFEKGYAYVVYCTVATLLTPTPTALPLPSATTQMSAKQALPGPQKYVK